MDEGCFKLDMIYSYRQLSSEGLYNELVEDVQELLDSSDEYGLIADTLVVGRLFLEVSSIRAVNKQFNIVKYPTHPEVLSAYFAAVKEKIRNVYDRCDESQGKFLIDISNANKLEVLFNPDEKYLTLICLDKDGKYVDTKSSPDNPYVSLYFKDSEILVDYLFTH